MCHGCTMHVSMWLPNHLSSDAFELFLLHGVPFSAFFILLFVIGRRGCVIILCYLYTSVYFAYPGRGDKMTKELRNLQQTLTFFLSVFPPPSFFRTGEIKSQQDNLPCLHWLCTPLETHYLTLLQSCKATGIKLI